MLYAHMSMHNTGMLTCLCDNKSCSTGTVMMLNELYALYCVVDGVL